MDSPTYVPVSSLSSQRFLLGVVAIGVLAVPLLSPLMAQATGKTSTAKTQVKSVAKKKPTYRLKPPPANYSPAVITLPQAVFDWGSVLQGEIVQHTFEIKNTGGMPLRIERVKAACGCTTVKYDNVIAPGQIGNVVLKVDTKRFSGTVKKTASVYSNASRTAQKLTMQGKIETPLAFDPKLPRIDVIRGTSVKPLSITVTKSTTRDIQVNGVEVQKGKENLLAATLKEIEPGQKYILEVTPSIPANASKYHTVEVNLKTVTEGKPVDIPLRVSIRVKDRIEAAPPSIYFTRRDTDKLKQEGAPPITRQVEIKTLDPNHTFRVTNVRLNDGSNMEASWETIEEGKRYRVTVMLPQLPTHDTRRLVEKVIVETDDTLVPTLTLNATASFSLRTK